MTTTNRPTDAVEHEISVETVHLPAGRPLRAVCLCGWASPILPSRPQAAAAGEAHIAEPTVSSILSPTMTLAQAIQASREAGVSFEEALGAANPKPRAAWQTEPCPPWCVDTHHDWEMPRDRKHYSAKRDVTMRLMESDYEHDSSFELASLHVLLQKREGGRPTVLIYTDDLRGPSVEIDLHPFEAADLASALLEAAQEAQR